VIDALREVRQRSDDLAKDILVYSFGPLNRADAAYALSVGVLDRFRKHEAVTAEEALRVLRTFDLLLVSTDTSRSRIIPAKLFDYLPSGRPILSLSRNPEVAEILDRTGTGVQIDPLDTAAVADFLLEGIRARRAGRKLPVRFEPQEDEIGRFEARRTTAKLAELFNDLVQRRQGSPRGDEKFGFPS
jgi:glycosyltransferase involved in cell wall biosynthesis